MRGMDVTEGRPKAGFDFPSASDRCALMSAFHRMIGVRLKATGSRPLRPPIVLKPPLGK